MDDLTNALLQGLKEEATKSKAEMDTACKEVMKDLRAKNPNLMNVKVERHNKIEFEAFFGGDSVESPSWERFHSQVEVRMLKQISSEIEKSLNKSVQDSDLKNYLWIEREDKNNQWHGVAHCPKQIIDKLRQDSDDFRVQTVTGIRDILRQTMIDNARNINQVVLPDICMTLNFPTSNTINILRHREEAGVIKEQCIYSLPSVTLDTDVFLKMKRGEPVDILEFRKTHLVDLAVSQRIREDILLRPDEEQLLFDAYIRKIPSIMRCSFDSRAKRFLLNPKFNKPGCTEFLKFTESIINSYFKPKGETPPGYLDWDHLHAHYLSGRDIFLTDDQKILKIKEQLEEELGITVMNLEDFLNSFESIDDLIKSLEKSNSTINVEELFKRRLIRSG